MYLIQLPEHHGQLARELSWRKGKIYRIRPVFRALGAPAALVHEAIERGRHSPTAADIIRTAGIIRTAVETALAAMASLGIIHREGRQRKITAAANLTHLAIRLGVMDEVQARTSRNRCDRAQWHAWLDRFNSTDGHRMREEDLFGPERDEHWLRPPTRTV